VLVRIDLSQLVECVNAPDSPFSLEIKLVSPLESAFVMTFETEKEYNVFRDQLVINVVRLNISKFRKSGSNSTLRASASIFSNLMSVEANREVCWVFHPALESV